MKDLASTWPELAARGGGPIQPFAINIASTLPKSSDIFQMKNPDEQSHRGRGKQKSKGRKQRAKASESESERTKSGRKSKERAKRKETRNKDEQRKEEVVMVMETAKLIESTKIG